MIYLASTSPRRKALLKSYGIKFKIVAPDYEELNQSHSSPAQAVKRHALEKGKSCLHRVSNGIILSADTIVFLGRKIIGKPMHLKDARRILRKLQNRWHRVYTGVALIKVRRGRIERKNVFFEMTRVKLKSMGRTDINKYFKKINPLDKAGAYAIQSRQPNIIQEVKGSLTNAIGLPMETLLKKMSAKS